MIISNQKIAQRSVLASAQGKPSFESVVELAFYGAIVVALVAKWLPPSRGARRWPMAVLFAWPVFALLSTAWSVIPLFTFVRGLQLFVPVAFAVFTARLLDQSGGDGSSLARPAFRIYVNLTTFLALFAFAFPYTFSNPAITLPPGAVLPPDNRLAWFGVHPLEAAEILGVGLLILVVAGRRFLGLSFVGWAVRLAILAAATARTQGRSALLGLVLVLLVALWVGGRDRPLRRHLGTLYYIAFAVGAVGLFQHQLFDAATRGEGTTRLFNLDGRIPLWQLTIDQIHGLRELLFGSGLGSSRVALYNQVSWAGQTHNSFVEALVGTGVVGVLLLLAFLGSIAWLLWSRQTGRRMPPALHATVVATFALLLIIGITSPELASPGFSYTWVCFAAVFGLRAAGASGDDTAELGYRSGRFLP
jgi:O-antigen ligase